MDVKGRADVLFASVLVPYPVVAVMGNGWSGFALVDCFDFEAINSADVESKYRDGFIIFLALLALVLLDPIHVLLLAEAKYLLVVGSATPLLLSLPLGLEKIKIK